VRGENKTPTLDGICRATLRGESSQAERAAGELLATGWRADPGKATLLKTRKEIDRGWRTVREILDRQGKSELAGGVRRFDSIMEPPLTDREQMAAIVIERARGACVNPAPRSR
jgi:hypothetical protein